MSPARPTPAPPGAAARLIPGLPWRVVRFVAGWRTWPALRTLVRWYGRRPFLTAWGCLAAGMVLILALFGRDAGLTLRQHVTLAAVTVGLAWLCTWIVFQESGPDGQVE